MLSPSKNNKKTLIALGIVLGFLALAGCKKGGVNIVASITQPVISAGENNCEVNTAGRVLCWNDNDNGLEGRRVNQMDMETIKVHSGYDDNNNPTYSSVTNAIAVDTGENIGCVLINKPNQNLEPISCWQYQNKPDYNYTAYTARKISSWGSTDDIKQIAVGTDYVCALLRNGTVECVEMNASLSSDWIFLYSPANPVEVSQNQGLAGVAFISAGYAHSCALLKNGKVMCWGSNGKGELGDGTTTDSNYAVEVQGLNGIAKAISAGKNYSCATLSDNTVKCWGSNSSGQLGYDTVSETGLSYSLSPVKVGDIADARSISAGNEHTCAILRDNTVKCWGANDKGQLGNLEKVDSLTPVEVLVEGINKNIRSISVGNKHSCALRSDNTVKCWGGDEPPATP